MFMQVVEMLSSFLLVEAVEEDGLLAVVAALGDAFLIRLAYLLDLIQ